MATECSTSYLDLPMLGSRRILADFDGGALLLRKTEEVTGIIHQFAACFPDHRDPDLVEHPVPDLVAQRVYGGRASFKGVDRRASTERL